MVFWKKPFEMMKGVLFKKKDIHEPIFVEDIRKPITKYVDSKKPKNQMVSTVVNYEYNPNYFYEWKRGHRIHQQRALSSIAHGGRIGQINIPTGTGKTRIQVSLHIDDMIRKTNNNTVGVYGITAHRLSLCSQLLDDMVGIAIKCGIKFDILYIGSGKSNSKDYYSTYNKEFGYNEMVSVHTQTTDRDVALKSYKNAIDNNRHLIIVSTYHSLDVLNFDTFNMDICTFDEAHTIINDKANGDDESEWGLFYSNLMTMKSNNRFSREYYFTATPKIKVDEDSGISSMYEDVFGETLFSASFTEMVDEGEIVHPKFHFVSPKNLWDGVDDNDDEDKYTNPTMLCKLISESFEEHKKQLHELSSDKYKIGAKLLITAKNIPQVDAIIKVGGDIDVWSKENNIKIFSIHSQMKGNTDDTLKEIQQLDSTEDCIIIHVRMIAEGIDVPSITGILSLVTFKNNESRLIQTIGRASRLHHIDRKNLYSNKISPRDYSNMIKPYSMIILPYNFFNENEQTDIIKNIVKIVSLEYSIPLTEIFIKEEQSNTNSDSNDNDKNDDIPLEDFIGDDNNNLDDIMEWEEEELVHIKEEMTTDEYNLILHSNDSPISYIFDGINTAISNKNLSNKERGIKFEKDCANILSNNGWNTELTKSSNDKGADILMNKNGLSVVVQCKYYKSNVGSDAVQQANTAKDYYNTHSAVVVCSTDYTSSAKDMAERVGVLLIKDTDLHNLDIMLNEYSK